MKTTIFDILIPRLSNKIIDCQVARWRKNVGDSVMEGEVIVELETEKTTFEIESPCEGVLDMIYVFEGEEVIDGERIGVINAEGIFGDDDDDDEEFDDDDEEEKIEDEELGEDSDDEDEDDEDLEELEDLEKDEDAVYSRYSGDDEIN